MPALSKITEKIPAQFDSGMQLAEMMEIHRQKMEEYRKLREYLEMEAVKEAEALTNKGVSDRPEEGVRIDPGKLARLIDLQRMHGAKNVNFVTPTPHVHTILKTVREISINTPVIWNSNMYHSPEIAEILEGIVDVYLGDFKYGNDSCARKYSKIKNYLEIIQPNFEFAYKTAEILLRHLILPGHLECCTKPISEWVAKNIPHIRFNLMFQYRPCYRVMEYPELNRGLTPEEKLER
jgi:putative pyruvate formate lyase activating enzyme